MSFVPIKLELEATFACRHCDGEFPMTQSHEDYFGNQWLGYSCPKCNARHHYQVAKVQGKVQARRRTRTFVDNGTLVKAECCSVPGCAKPAQAHHPDYSRPELIYWLCRSHHLSWHYANAVLNSAGLPVRNRNFTREQQDELRVVHELRASADLLFLERGTRAKCETAKTLPDTPTLPTDTGC